jgi:hypothetical protein
MDTMTEKQLRAINPVEYEGVDVTWQNGSGKKATGRVLFDYDQGLSVLNKENTEECLAGFHGPAYTPKKTNYTTKEVYHKDLSAVFSMLKYGFYNTITRRDLCGESTNVSPFGSTATCSFT